MAQELAKPGHNSADPTKWAELFKSYFRIEDEIDGVRERHAEELDPYKEQQSDILTLVKASGFSPKAFKLEVRDEKRRRASARDRAKQDRDVLDEADRLRAAIGQLGGTPLGDAALARVAPESGEVSQAGNSAELLNKLTVLQ